MECLPFCRIVTLLAYDQDARNVVAGASKERVNGYRWAWILVSSITAPVPQQAVGWLLLQQLLPSENVQAFTEQVSEYTKSRFKTTATPDSVDLAYSLALHDAIMLYAYAATKVLSEGGNLQDGQAVTEAVRSTPFEGMGGDPVVLDSQGNRLDSYEVHIVACFEPLQHRLLFYFREMQRPCATVAGYELRGLTTQRDDLQGLGHWSAPARVQRRIQVLLEVF